LAAPWDRMRQQSRFHRRSRDSDSDDTGCLRCSAFRRGQVQRPPPRQTGNGAKDSDKVMGCSCVLLLYDRGSDSLAHKAWGFVPRRLRLRELRPHESVQQANPALISCFPPMEWGSTGSCGSGFRRLRTGWPRGRPRLRSPWPHSPVCRSPIPSSRSR
jgi:hypothetical protein